MPIKKPSCLMWVITDAIDAEDPRTNRDWEGIRIADLDKQGWLWHPMYTDPELGTIEKEELPPDSAPSTEGGDR